MSNLKYVDIPWYIHRQGRILVDHVSVNHIDRCFTDLKIDKTTRVLPDGQLKDGCYIHQNIGKLTKLARRLPVERSEGLTLIVLNGGYHLIRRREINPNFKRYPTYPGGEVYRDLINFRKRHPDYMFHHREDVFDHWYYTEGEGHKQRLNNRLRVYKIKKHRND